MKDRTFRTLAALALIGVFSTTPVFAQDSSAKMGNMAGMDMEHMKGMKHDCMAKHKDGKMCDKEMMQKCEMKMSKGDCKKMMDHAMAPTTEKTK